MVQRPQGRPLEPALRRHAQGDKVEYAFIERRQERRSDPVLGALVDVAIAYRENLGGRVAEAFLRETGVPEAVALRVLERTARQRSTVPRRWTPRAVPDTAADE